MKISQEGLSLIKKFEGCRLEAYYCSGGVLTIGYGHTGGVKESDTITQEEAEKLLRADVFKFEKNVEDDFMQYWRSSTSFSLFDTDDYVQLVNYFQRLEQNSKK